ncbi:MAG: polymer-forming cytoskeletal protein [Spirochaetia bacterium]|nr:polymer-forming cytoskeletal protein [Spirochaetia bacterium]
METTEITEDIIFRGEINYDGRLDVSGKLEGKIISEGALVVNNPGFFKGDIRVRQVTLKGEVSANVKCELITIMNSGKIFGDIECKQIQIDRGGIHNGVTIMN